MPCLAGRGWSKSWRRGFGYAYVIQHALPTEENRLSPTSCQDTGRSNFESAPIAVKQRFSKHFLEPLKPGARSHHRQVAMHGCRRNRAPSHALQKEAHRNEIES